MLILKNTIQPKSNIEFSFKSLFKFKYSLEKTNLINTRNTIIFNDNNLILSKSIFCTFIKLNGWLISGKLSIHYSFNSYFHYVSPTLNFINLRKIFMLWSNILSFITNVFFFKIDYLVFSNTYFKYETLVLNWLTSKHFRYIWKYSSPFIFFLNNKTTFYTESFFRFLINKNIRLAFLIDLHYHSKSLFYLNKFKFISIGPVPLSANLYLLSLALPVSSNSVLSNLFFFRLLLKIKKLNSTHLYESYWR